MARKQLLTIDDLSPERPYVTIEGKDYDLRLGREFGLRDQARIRRWYARIQELLAQAADVELEDDELAMHELSERMRDFVALAVIGTSDASCDRHRPGAIESDSLECSCPLLKRMQDHHLITLVQAFGLAAGITTTATPTPQPNRQARRQRQNPPTTATSSRRAKGSTAATP